MKTKHTPHKTKTQTKTPKVEHEEIVAAPAEEVVEPTPAETTVEPILEETPTAPVPEAPAEEPQSEKSEVVVYFADNHISDGVRIYSREIHGDNFYSLARTFASQYSNARIE